MAKGPNGERRLCASCGAWHAPHAPDNTTQVPVCKECWDKCPITTKVFAISTARVSSRIEALDNTIFEGIEGAIADLVKTRDQRARDFESN